MTRKQWLAMIGLTMLFASPAVLALIRSHGASASEPALAETITLKIDGWTCANCEKDIRRALLAIPGVKRAEVSYARGGAIVEVDPALVKPEQLIQAVARAGTVLSSYHATVVPNGTLPPHSDRGWLQKLFGLFR